MQCALLYEIPETAQGLILTPTQGVILTPVPASFPHSRNHLVVGVHRTPARNAPRWQTKLLAVGLSSDAAQSFLQGMDSVDELMPALAVDDFVPLLNRPEGT